MQPVLQPLFFLGDAVGNELSSQVPVVELVRQTRKDVWRAQVQANVKQIGSEVDGWVRLKEAAGDAGRLVLARIVIHQDSIALRRIQTNNQVLRR
jgi:hypothetical protein